jgi:hypothetical protein
MPAPQRDRLVAPISSSSRPSKLRKSMPSLRTSSLLTIRPVREAGVVYFIDRALKTFASDSQKSYIEGLPDLQARVREMFPGVEKFSAAAPEQQDEVLRSFDENSDAKNFFETLCHHTIAGFLIDPDSDTGGNREVVGWKVIGRDREHVFQPPFGYYDKDYPAWQLAPKDAEKK